MKPFSEDAEQLVGQLVVGALAIIALSFASAAMVGMWRLALNA